MKKENTNKRLGLEELKYRCRDVLLIGPAGTILGVISGALYGGIQSATIGSALGAIFYIFDLFT